MAQKFAQSLRVNRGFVPSQPVAGEANDTIYAGKNIVFKGSPQAVHAETFRGSMGVIDSNTGSPMFIPTLYMYSIPGIQFTAGSDEITTVSGRFPQAGSSFVIENRLYIITNVYSATRAKISPAYEGTTHSESLTTTPVLCAMNDLLAIMHGGGSALSLPQGHILTAGIMGHLYVVANPAPTGKTRIVLFEYPVPGPTGGAIPEAPTLVRRKDDGTFETPRTLGFSIPPAPTLVAVAGGTKNMPAGRYSLRICRSSLATAGYGNPSEAAEITITAGQKIQATFPTKTENQTAWRVFCSLYSVAEGITGPWYELFDVPEIELEASSRIRTFEWRDYEVAGSQLVTFDNDVPPKASFVVMFGGMPVLISTYGPPLVPGTTFAPGPSVQPGKPYNIEGFPAGTSLAMGPVQNVISYVEGEGRLYLATNNYIHILSLTGNPDQPLTVRPYVQCAIVRHNALVYIEGTLYGFSARGPMRISGEGTGMEDRIFAAPVRAITERWKPARVFVVYDPHNESILWIHSNDSQNAGGFWRAMVLSYSLPLGIWSTPLYVEFPTADVVITGVATLGSRAFLLSPMGNGTLFMWDSPSALPVSWEMATPFMDQPGVAGAKKNIRHITVTHRGANTQVDVIGISAGGLEPSPFLASAPPPAMRAVAPGSAALISTTVVGKINVKNLRLYLIKLAGINAAADPLPNRVDEIIIDGNVHGPVT